MLHRSRHLLQTLPTCGWKTCLNSRRTLFSGTLSGTPESPARGRQRLDMAWWDGSCRDNCHRLPMKIAPLRGLKPAVFFVLGETSTNIDAHNLTGIYNSCDTLNIVWSYTLTSGRMDMTWYDLRYDRHELRMLGVARDQQQMLAPTSWNDLRTPLGKGFCWLWILTIREKQSRPPQFGGEKR